MITSTPRKANAGNNLRKSILLKSALRDVPSPRRSLNDITNQDSIISEPVNDDLERSSRRIEADIQRRVSNIPSISSSPKNFTQEEIQDHFQMCLKMFTENKINAKNVWNLKMIDYIRNIVSPQGMAKDTLQLASTSLDVSAKIYGIRVDNVHSDGLRLASNMARTGATVETAEGDEDGGGEGAAPDEAPKRKKKPKRMMRGLKATIAKDTKSLLGDVVKLESVFFQNRVNLEASAVENLISYRIPLNHGCYKYMLLSKETAWSSYEKQDPVVTNQNTFELNMKEVKLHICPAFAEIHIDEWDPDKENKSFKEDIRPSFNQELVYDPEGVPIAELDGSIHDVFANGDMDNGHISSDEEELNAIGEAAVNPTTVAHIIDFKPTENSVYPDDYSYSNSVVNLMGNKRITQIWAGPSHWKLKHIQHRSSRFSGQQEPHAQKQKKARFHPILIDFNTYVHIDKKNYNKTKRCKVTEEPYKITFPPLIFKENMKHRPLILKHVFINNKLPAEDGIESEGQPYNYENPNDSQYCSQNIAADNDDSDNHMDDGGDFQNDYDHQQSFTQQPLEGNLVEAPEMVPKTYVPYAMHAKKINMKKLKHAMHNILIGNKHNEQISDDDMHRKKILVTMFSNAYKQLPPYLPENMRKELSAPLAFAALLHLANEENLQLTGQNDLKDVKIEPTNKFTK